MGPWLSVLTPQGPTKAVLPVVVCDPPLPHSKVRVRATGRALKSGFGIIVAGTWLTSGLAGVRTMRNSRNLPTTGSLELPASASLIDRSLSGFFPFVCCVRFTHQTFDPTA